MNNCLYLVTSEEYSKKPTLDTAKEAINAGIDVLQMREKNKSKEELVILGKELRKLCQNTTFIVNDDPYLANEVDADGVHLGQEDFLKFNNAREIVKNKIIGLSTHSFEEVKAANDLDINYIAYGPVFKTKTKDYSLGTNDIEEVLKIAEKPVVFIGGINETNIDEVLGLGAKNIALITAITASDDIDLSVKKLKGKITKQTILTLNGKVQLISAKSLPQLFEEKNFNVETVVVEYNHEVVKSDEFDDIMLKDNDNLEIVSFFAGG